MGTFLISLSHFIGRGTSEPRNQKCDNEMRNVPITLFPSWALALRNTGVEAQLAVGRGCEFCFARRDQLETFGDFVRLELALGEVQIQLEMARFGAFELLVQIAHL